MKRGREEGESCQHQCPHSHPFFQSQIWVGREARIRDPVRRGRLRLCDSPHVTRTSLILCSLGHDRTVQTRTLQPEVMGEIRSVMGLSKDQMKQLSADADGGQPGPARPGHSKAGADMDQGTLYR